MRDYKTKPEIDASNVEVGLNALIRKAAKRALSHSEFIEAYKLLMDKHAEITAETAGLARLVADYYKKSLPLPLSISLGASVMYLHSSNKVKVDNLEGFIRAQEQK